MKYSISVHNKNHPPNGRFPLFPTVAGFTGRDDTYFIQSDNIEAIAFDLVIIIESDDTVSPFRLVP